MMMAQLLILKILEQTELINLLDEVEGKVIIWANYIHDIEALVKTISKEYGEETVVQYYGATSSEDRAKAIKKLSRIRTLKLNTL